MSWPWPVGPTLTQRHIRTHESVDDFIARQAKALHAILDTGVTIDYFYAIETHPEPTKSATSSADKTH